MGKRGLPRLQPQHQGPTDQEAESVLIVSRLVSLRSDRQGELQPLADPLTTVRLNPSN